jgi:hypothetical protein
VNSSPGTATTTHARTEPLIAEGKSSKRLVEVKQFGGGHYPVRIEYDGDPPLGWMVYFLLDPANGRPFYIGKTCKFIIRMRAHCQVRTGRNPYRRLCGTDILNDKKILVCAAGGAIRVTWIQCASEADADALEYRLIRENSDTILNTQTNRWEVVRA